MPRHIRHYFAIAVALIMLGSAAAHAQPTSPLKWTRCSADLPAELECAQLQVPLDYAVPWGETITLGMNRLRATDAASRIGSLIFEAGGPGGAGTGELIAEVRFGNVFSPRLRKYFDIIGFDPRGVGTSTRVKCDPKIRNEEPSLFPRSQAEFDKLVQNTTAFGQSCLELTGPLLGHLDTETVVQDLELVRQALGDDELNYLGLSYGSMVGAEYAERFPDTIRVMALDGAFDHSQSEDAWHLTEVHSVEDSFMRFSQWCSETKECALYGKDIPAEYDKLIQQANQNPIPAKLCAETGACRATVTGDDILKIFFASLISKDGFAPLGYPSWADWATALKQAMEGDASGFAHRFKTSEVDADFPGDAILCADFPATANIEFDHLAARHLVDEALAPHTRGGSQTWWVQTRCLGWPVPGQNPVRPLRVHGTPPILIINATHDPSTSIAWALEMLNQIPSAVLLVREGDGHTSYRTTRPSRTRDAIDEYLITGKTPPPNTILPD
jgi:pimeloyl-ACP methyl ester carboxylesterase